MTNTIRRMIREKTDPQFYYQEFTTQALMKKKRALFREQVPLFVGWFAWLLYSVWTDGTDINLQIAFTFLLGLASILIYADFKKREQIIDGILESRGAR